MLLCEVGQRGAAGSQQRLVGRDEMLAVLQHRPGRPENRVAASPDRLDDQLDALVRKDGGDLRVRLLRGQLGAVPCIQVAGQPVTL